jgi:glycosyltransferase involved in cell wall biosynthesis
MKTIKVVLVDHESKLGGAELSMVGIAKNMSTDVQYTCAITGLGEFADALKNAGIKDIKIMPMDGWRWWKEGIINRIKLLLSIPLQLLNVVKWILLYKKLKPDIIHFNLTRMVEPIIAAKLLGLKTVMHFREFEENNSSFWGGNKAHYSLMNLCNYWIANSQFTFSQINKHCKGCVITIPNGIELFTAGKKQFEPFYKIGMVAGLVPWKNHTLFLDIANILVQQNNAIQFYLYGKGEPEYIEKLKTYALSIGILNHIHFKGYVQNISSIYSNLDAVIHTSNKESFGRIYIECMISETPIFALKGGEANNIIKHGFNGFLYDENELTDMANDILNLLANKTAQNQLIANGKTTALQYSIANHCNSLFQLYKHVLA